MTPRPGDPRPRVAGGRCGEVRLASRMSMMFVHVTRCTTVAALLLGGLLGGRAGAVPALPAGGLPVYLPRYRIDVDLDVASRRARVLQTATWTNPTAVPTDRLVF